MASGGSAPAELPNGGSLDAVRTPLDAVRTPLEAVEKIVGVAAEADDDGDALSHSASVAEVIA